MPANGSGEVARATAEPGYGLGYAQLLDALIRLVESGQPLLRLEGNKGLGFSENYPQISQLAFTLTEAGHAVLQGQHDWWEMQPSEFWLGGVRLVPPNPRWRWDEERHALAG